MKLFFSTPLLSPPWFLLISQKQVIRGYLDLVHSNQEYCLYLLTEGI